MFSKQVERPDLVALMTTSTVQAGSLTDCAVECRQLNCDCFSYQVQDKASEL
ncbi:hypothetical protein BgiMline_036325, partial [Biomphalaria glabrata]